jgi:predicted flap endonuclease-1-like 5' DNA nuclease
MASSGVSKTETKELEQPKEVAPKTVGLDADKKDDLKKIEGIGPKIEQLLNADAIYTFEHVIGATVERIRGILIAAGPNYAVHDPSTWAEQAKLANTAQWEALDALQEELKGGKRK